MINLSILALIIALIPEVISSRSEAFSKRVSESDYETLGMLSLKSFEATKCLVSSIPKILSNSLIGQIKELKDIKETLLIIHFSVMIKTMERPHFSMLSRMD